MLKHDAAGRLLFNSTISRCSARFGFYYATLRMRNDDLDSRGLSSSAISEKVTDAASLSMRVNLLHSTLSAIHMVAVIVSIIDEDKECTTTIDVVCNAHSSATTRYISITIHFCGTQRKRSTMLEFQDVDARAFAA